MRGKVVTMPINSRQKGKRGEREVASIIRDAGWDARRGVQYSGGADSPDVVSALPYHIEVKLTDRLRIRDAIDQAARDSAGRRWCVWHRGRNQPWMVTITADEFLDLARNSGL